eukprot:UN14405
MWVGPKAMPNNSYVVVQPKLIIPNQIITMLLRRIQVIHISQRLQPFHP